MCMWHSVVLSIYSGAEEGFKNGGAGYSSLSEAGRTHRKVPNKSVGISLLCFVFVVAVVLGPAVMAFGQLSDTDSFLNSSHVCALWLAGPDVQSGRSLLILGGVMSPLGYYPCHFFHLQAGQGCFSLVSHFAEVMSLSCSAEFQSRP